MSLSLSEPRFEPVKNTVDECKEKDINYSAPLYVTAEFINNDTQEIKSQTVFIGDFPMMTEKVRSSSTAPSVLSFPSWFAPRASTSIRPSISPPSVRCTP